MFVPQVGELPLVFPETLLSLPVSALLFCPVCPSLDCSEPSVPSVL
jgi:hypothetical protein